MNKSTKHSSARGGIDDKILVIVCVTVIAVLSIGLAGGVILVFRTGLGEVSGLIQSILSVVMSIVTGLMGIAVGRGMASVDGQREQPPGMSETPTPLKTDEFKIPTYSKKGE